MFCNKCGNFVNDNQQYCNKCGNYLDNNAPKRQNNHPEYNINRENRIVPFMIIIISVVAIILLSIKLFSQKKEYYLGYRCSCE